METDIPRTALSWLDIWWMAFLHPTIKTFSRIIGDPKASLRWGVLWAAIAACLAWLLSPVSLLVWGWLNQLFGMQALWLVSLIGAVAAAAWGVLSLLLLASIAHELACLFEGAGTIRHLAYCWGILPLPFLLLAAVVLRLPIVHYSPGTPATTFVLVATFGKVAVAALIILYLAYAQVIAFGAVEGFSAWKAFGVLALLSVALGLLWAWLSAGLSAWVGGAYRY